MGATQDAIDRITAVETQARDELIVLQAEVTALLAEAQAAGIDTSKATAAADALSQTLDALHAAAVEVPLEGGDLAKATDAALKAVPEGSTILRAETDAQGAAFEVHVQLADGTQAMVKMDADFNVTGVVPGDDDTPAAPPVETPPADTPPADAPPADTPPAGPTPEAEAIAAAAVSAAGIPEGSTVTATSTDEATGVISATVQAPDGTLWAVRLNADLSLVDVNPA